MDNTNKHETGARKLPARPDADPVGVPQDAAANKPPKGIGNCEPLNDVEGKTRHSDGVRRPAKSGDARKDSGAGPALARHSKDV